MTPPSSPGAQRPVSVDTTDPQVRRLMGMEDRQVERFAREAEGGAPQRDLVHIAGDADTGMTSTINLAGGKSEVFATYRGKSVPPEFSDGLRLTLDVYAIPGEPIQVHLICPRCRQQLRVSADRKQILWEPNVGNRGSRDGGKLEIEPFQCTWEMPESGAHTPGILAGGLTLCQWKGVIEHKHGKNLVRDA